ncbi:glycosyltransferase family 2 protein [Candidatus Microgenomates bacterium]|jgi:GT2 family glycosyltransferase|nr:MAG: glycosyltransferase family 2 protein [Candidatus Microgenomates bacterium]
MNKKNPLVSVLIVNYNGGAVLDSCLASLKKTDYPNFETIVVDNGSTDESIKMIKKKYKWVILSEAKKNLGFAAGNNFAYKSSGGEYIALLNGDTEVEPGWLRKLVEFAQKHKDGAAFAAKVLFFDDKKTLNSAGGLCDWYGFSPLRGTFEKDEGQYDSPDMVFYAHGAAMMIRRETIEKIGFFDEDYFIYHEELDFCWRAWIFGYKVYYVPGSVVYHKLKQRNFYAPEKRAQRQFLVKKNRISTLIKNHKSLSLLTASLLVNFIVSLGETVFYLSKGDLQTIKGTFMAYFWNVKHFRKDWKKRKRVQKLYMADEVYILKRMKRFPVAIDIFKGIISGKLSLPL